MPQSEVVEGMVGTGWTVSRGTEPEPFTAEVVGIRENFLGPGRNLIVVDVSSDAIDEAGGIWAGMSGSPVYIDGRLVGALGYRFGFQSSIGGVTPGADLVGVLGAGGPATKAATAPTRQASAVTTVEGQTGAFNRLVVPLAVSGLATERLEALGEQLADRRFDVLPVASTAPGGTPGPVVPGGNFAGVLSTGDVTTAGIGTTSYVCDGNVVALAHSLFFGGETNMAAAGAEAMAIIDDRMEGLYKLANVTGLVGTVEQDRLSGVGGPLGPTPDGTPVTTTVTALQGGATRTGSTDIFESRFVPDLAMFHTVSSIDSVTDRIGRGSARVDFAIRGHRPDGSAFTVTRQNVVASSFDIATEAADELGRTLALLLAGGIEDMTTDRIHADIEVDTSLRRLRVVSATVTVGGGEPVGIPLSTSDRPLPELPIAPGSLVRVEVELSSFGGGDGLTETVELLPDRMPQRPGTLVVRGGPGSTLLGPAFECEEQPSLCPASFDGLRAALAELPRDDDLVVELRSRPDGTTQPVEGDPDSGELVARAVKRLDRTVTDEVRAPTVPARDVEPRPGDLEVVRAGGEGRITTAVALSRLSHPDPATVDTVVVAGTSAGTDALAAAPLAAARGGPLLLTPSGELHGVVEAEIDRLGATRAVIVGGTAAVSDAAADSLRGAGLAVQRIAGGDRVATAAAIAARIPGPAAYVADADALADAAAAAGLAAQQGAPLLYSRDDRLPDATASAAAQRQAVTIVGGTAAVPESVVDALDGLNVAVDRLAGATRYATSAAVAQRSLEVGASAAQLFLTTGRSTADAPGAGPAAAAAGAPLLLVEGAAASGGADALALLARLGGAVDRLVIVGGEAAITGAVVSRMEGVLTANPAS